MDEANDCIVKARGLPWAATTKDVATFFEDCNIIGQENGIHLTMDRNGRPSGECFIELASMKDVEKAKAHNKENMGKRYIEIQDAKRDEMEWFINRMPGGGGMGECESDGFVRLRGLPFETTKNDIAAFFAGIEIVPYGITLTMDQNGRPSGDAYIEFTTPEEAEKALKKNKERIGHRYIEIFKSSKSNVKYVVPSANGQGGGFPHLLGGRAGPYDRPGFGNMNMGANSFNGNIGGRNPRGGPGGPVRGGRNMGGKGPECSTTGHMVHMRGLPYQATQGDVYLFLAPLNPVEVRILHEESGRPKGECDVDFHTHNEAVAAMMKNKQNMGHRYVEMFLRSVPDSNDRSGNEGLSRSNNLPGMMNSGGTNGIGNSVYGGFGSGGIGSNNGGSGNGILVGGGGGHMKEEFGIGGGGNSGGYSSFDDKTNFSNHTQSTGNYYSSMR